MKRLRLDLCCAVAAALVGFAPPAFAEDAEAAAVAPDAADAKTEPEARQHDVCTLIESAAAENGLPIGFFTRLIWKESRFRHDAVSPKGAQGIAQFMPGTALERGLADPFDVTAAIPASARFLSDLKIRFGNLGLAAAAYNAGPNRVSDWLADQAVLPFETRDYVLSVTGAPAETWADPTAAAKVPAPPAEEEDCLALAARLKGPGAPLAPDVETVRAPWGVQVAGGFSRARVIDAYGELRRRFAPLLADRPPMIVGGRMPGRGARPFYRARIPAQSREEGEKICASLKRAGGSCVVLKS
jgi:hypothetical protein